jgi:glycosyltransferase involved in cell wall biosynthesis
MAARRSLISGTPSIVPLAGPVSLRGICVVLPAYNEEAVIAQTIIQCVEVLSVIAPDYEIVVVDDGSRDQTGAILDALSTTNQRIRIIHNKSNRGYGGALIAGFDAAAKALTFFMDSDGQFDIQDLAILLAQREQGHRVVLGYRRKRQDGWVRKLNAWGWNLLVSSLFGLRVRDVDCAFKLYDTELVRLCDIHSEGAMVNTEMLVKLSRLRIPFVQVPVHHYPRQHGSATGANPGVVLRAFLELLRLRLSILRWHPLLPLEEQAN